MQFLIPIPTDDIRMATKKEHGMLPFNCVKYLMLPMNKGCHCSV